jgi:hypothetical protein
MADSPEKKAEKIVKEKIKAAGGRRIIGGRLRYSGVKAVKAEKKKQERQK